ncbi:MAG: oligosaccharide flippase family protein [Prevotella sp.]|nr:oligosaccharide flippase family protein [Prevotella sp.]
MKSIDKIRVTLLNSKLFRDSFWAVFGNGIGNALMLFSGIIIARLLGKELYGEYGIVKTTMFYIASFATLGLGVTSTKYIASLISENSIHVGNIIRDSISITLIFSGLIAFILFISASSLADFLNESSLVIAFKALAIVIIFKAITTTQIGILAGFKNFKTIAINSLLSGFVMLLLCIPLTYKFGLKGSLATLLISQIFNSLINFFSIRKKSKDIPLIKNVSYKKELICFSFPVALQESSFTICNWAAIMMLTKISSIGEVGLYTASAQWNSIITMIPGLLINVVLSYLSGSVNQKHLHEKNLKLMLCVNFITTIIPFIIVYFLANFIASFYGDSFSEMPSVLRVLTFSTILEACASVYKSELLALGKTWLLFSIRFVRDFVLVVSVFVLLNYTDGKNGAIMYSWAVVIMSVIFLLTLFIVYKFEKNRI